MMILSAFLIAELISVTGGKNDTFKSALAEIPEQQISEETSAEHTPGSSAWYNLIERFRIPLHWAVYSNGVPVKAGSADINREPEIIHSPGNGLLDLVIRTADGIETAYMPEQFDVKWSLRHYAVATNYTDLICADTYGKPLYWMCGHKLDKYLYGAYFSSYNAYFERIYFGGMKEGSSFEGEDWYVPQTSNQFVRNGPAPDYHRLREYPIITNFMEHVSRMSSNLKATLVPNDMSSVDEHPSFYDSSSGILDNSLSFESELPAYVYWASTFDPPPIEQNVSFETNDVLRIPDDSELGKLLPTFGWQEDAIATRDDKGNLVESHFWQCYAITLDALFDPTRGFTENPIEHLFENVGVEESAGPIDFVRGYKIGKYDYLTNLYSFAAMSSPNADVSLGEYKKCFGEYARSRKILPGAFVGANHTLGVMDRIIYVPTMNINVEHAVVQSEQYALFTSDSELNISLTYDESSRRWKLDDRLHDITFRATSEFQTDSWYDLDPVSHPYLQLKVSPVSVGLHESSDSAESYGSIIYLTQENADIIFDESGAIDYIDIDDTGSGFDGFGNPYVILYYTTDTDPGTTRYSHVGIGGNQCVIKFHPTVTAQATYEAVTPTQSSQNPAENHVPSRSTTDRVSANKIAFLDRRDIGTGNSYDYTTEYRSLGESTVTAWNTDPYGVHERRMFDELDDIFSGKTGRDWRDQSDMCRIPDNVTFKFSADNSFLDEDGTVKDTLQTEYEHEEPAYDCTIPITVYMQFDQSNVVDRTMGFAYSNGWSVVEVRQQTEEGWEFAWAETNIVWSDAVDLGETVTTNSMTAPVLADETILSRDVRFLQRSIDDIQLEYETTYQTNLISGIAEYFTDHVYDEYEIESIFIDIDGNVTAETNHVTSVRDETIKSPWGLEYETTEGYEGHRLTGREVIDLATDVEETVDVTTCILYHRVYRDGRVEAWYLHPYTRERTVVSEGELPIQIGEYTATLIPDVNNTYTSEDIDAFTDGFDCKIRYSAIESADFEWHSMKASD